ncbi:MAG: hypothetical protein RL274_2170 [Pseudomonadota bacterium]|jgi:hypothetical protein
MQMFRRHAELRYGDGDFPDEPASEYKPSPRNALPRMSKAGANSGWSARALS